MLLAAILGLILIGSLFPAAASAAECTDTWTGPSEGAWSTPTDWSAGYVPGESDVACIGAGDRVNVGPEPAEVAVVQGAGVLALGGTLDLTGSAGISVLGSIAMGNGTLTGAGTLEITHEFASLFYPTLSGSGATIIRAGATALVMREPVLAGGAHLVNYGTFVLKEGMLTQDGNSELLNFGTFEVVNGGTTILRGPSSAQFTNWGVFSVVNMNTFKQVETPFANEAGGEVIADAGEVYFLSGGSSSGGDWEAAAGAALSLSGGYAYHFSGGTLTGKIDSDGFGTTFIVEGVSFGAGAEVALAGADLEIASGSVTVPKLSSYQNYQGHSRVTGSGDLFVSSELYLWAPLVMSGGGSTVIEFGATVNTDVYAELVLSARRFVNSGDFRLANGDVVEEAGSKILNHGTFTDSSEVATIVWAESGADQFVNDGSLRKTGGGESATVQPSFEENGSLVQEVGHFHFERPVAASSSTATPGHCKIDEPVDCATGNFTTDPQTDLEVGGRGVGLDLTRTYSAQAAAAGETGIFGHGWTNSFGDHLTSGEGGAIETLTEASGATVPFTRSGTGYTAPGWSEDSLSGSSESGFTLTLPDRTTEEFSGAGRLESVTDRDGNETTLAYDGEGDLETITDPVGRSITLTYDGEGFVESAEDPMGHVVHYTYESGDLKTVTLPGESSPDWEFGYDGSHRMTSMTDGRGGKLTNEYDASSRVVSQTDPAGRTTTWRYEGFHTTITDHATGAVTDEWFDSYNQPVSVTHGYGTADETTTTFTYTAAGLLASRTDGDGHTTTYGYDADGNRTSECDPEGDETRWAYNAAHELTSETNPNGEKTTITRNADGNPETISRPAPGKETQTVSYTYGPHGEVKTMTDPLGATWTYGYDEYGDRTSETDPEGDERTWAFDEDSQVTSTVSPRGNEVGAEPAKFTTTIERDALGRPIKITDPLGGVTKRSYDADGNVESVTDPNGRKTKFTYDADDERTTIERPNGDVEEIGYDGAGAVTTQIDGNKQKTTYVRNVLEQPVEIIDPLERKTVQTFDAAGNLKTRTDPDGRTTTYVYDKANRLKEVSYSSEPAQDVSLGYDEDGDVTSMVDGTGESTWEYDQLGRLVNSKDGNGETAAWEWNLGEEPIGLTYPNGRSISRSYDEDGRLESVTDWLGHTTSFAYNRDSEPTATTFPTGTGDTDEYGWDRADRMSSVTMKKGAETLASLAYSRDPAGQLESLVSKELPGAEEESFSYDEDERLTKAGASEFGYDAANNLTEAPGTNNAYDKASEIESATGATFTFDKEGERTKEAPSSGPATIYKYDQAGSLTAIERAEEGETPVIGESLGYDGLGLLASRTVGLTTTHLVWDPTESPELLLSDGAESYVYGPGGLAVEAISSEEEPTYLHHDQLGSTRLLTNASGEAAATFTYGPYGGLAGHTGTATTALGYAGQYTLGQSGLLYLRARYYDPTTAQFLTLDPLTSITRAPYLYAGDDPVNRRDRTGRAAESADGGYCPSPFCLPVPTQEQVERTAGALGELPREIEEFGGEVGSEVSSVWNSVFGGEESSEEAQPCDELRNTGDQDALIQLGKEAARRGGVSEGEAEILREWAEEFEVPFRGPEAHPDRGFGANPHIHVGPTNHIPVR